MSNYQQFQLQISTALPETDNSHTFLLAANRDLFAIKRTVIGANILFYLSLALFAGPLIFTFLVPIPMLLLFEI